MKKYLIAFVVTIVGYSIFFTAQIAKADFCSSLDGLSLYSLKDHKFLGKFTTNQYDADSIDDIWGSYGSKWDQNSIFDEWGNYADKYSDTSAYNKYAENSPVIIDDQFNIYGNLTLNQYSKYTPIHPLQALTCYILLSDDRLKDFLWALDEFDGQSKINSPKASSLPYPSLISTGCGTNSHLTSGSKCACDDGYVWVDPNDTKSLNCKLKQCSTNQTLVNNQCQCNAGFILNDLKSDCIAETTINANITSPTSNTDTNLYQRPNITVVIPSVTNSYIGKYGRKVYTDRPDPLKIIGAMVKGETDPATYIVDTDGTLRWIKTEAVAKRLFGTNWDSYITWFNDSIVYTYKFGDTIEN